MDSDKYGLFMDSATLAMAFPPCLSRRRQSLELDKHEMFIDWACACDGLFPLPLEEKTWWRRTTMSRSLTWLRLRWPFPPAWRGKGNHGVGQR